MTDPILPLPVILLGAPILAFCLVALTPLRKRGLLAAQVVIAFSTLSLIAACMLCWRQLGDPTLVDTWTIRWMPAAGQSLVDVGWTIDGVSAPMLVVVGFVALCVQVYSVGYLDDEPPAAIGRYFAWQALFVFAMQTLVLAPNLLQLFMGWELVGLCSYLLIGFWWRKPEAAKASVKAFWVTKTADSGILIALILLFSLTGGFAWMPGELSTGQLNLITGLLLLGIMGKSAQVPLHIWLPDAMQGPTPVSALLHAATMVAAGIFLVVRAWPLFEHAPLTLDIMLWVGAITAFTAACFALVQDDIKKMLAFSTCSQLGYMLAALGAGGMAAGYFHLTTHAFFKALLFLGAGSLIHAMGTNSMKAMGGLWRSMPGTFLLFTVGSLALAGIFPLAGFYSKDMVLESLHHAHAWVPLGLLVAGVGLTATYVGRSLFLVFGGTCRTPDAHPHEAPLSMMVPMVLLGALTVGAGFLLFGPFHRLLGVDAQFHWTGLGIAGLAIAFSGFGLAYWLTRGRTIGLLAPISALIRSAPLDRAYERVWHSVLLVFGRGVAWLDRYIIDGAINGFAWLFVFMADRARRLQTGRADHYIGAVVGGAVAVLLYTVIFYSLWGGAN
jgi:NADH-quinone oxidoreductase subunit L